MLNLRSSVVLALALPAGLSAQLPTVHLSPAATQAFEKYVDTAEAKMDWKARSAGRPGDDFDLSALNGSPINIRDGTVHDWVGSFFVVGASAGRVLQVFQDYPNYKKMFVPDVNDSKLVSREGDRWNWSMRVTRRAGLLSDTFDIDYITQYRPLSGGRWAVITRSNNVREVADGKPRKEGVGQGILWRLNTYWLIEPRPDGVYLECRAISLSRDIPAGLGWMVRPFVSTLPKDSLRATLEQARNALR